MNDLSVKIVESPKELVAEALVPTITESNTECEVDPLALEEEVKDSFAKCVIKQPEENNPDLEEKVGNCDENAKEETSLEGTNEDTSNISPTENGDTEETLKQGNISLAEADSNLIVEDNDKMNVKVVDKTNVPANNSLSLTEEIKLTPKDVLLAAPKVEDAKDIIKEVQAPLSLEVKVTALDKDFLNSEAKESKLQDIKEQDMEVGEVATMENKREHKVEIKTNSQPMNGDVSKEEQPTKRPSTSEIETETPLKKLCQEVEKTFPQHDSMINDYIQTATKNNVDEVQRHTEQLLAEIQTLRELAQKKEHEWNNILHLKKVKEEILLRLLRRKQVLSFEKSADMNGSERSDPFDYLNQAKNLAIDKSDEISGLSIKQPGPTSSPLIQNPVPPVSHFNPMAGLPPPYDKAARRPVFPQPMMMAGPTLPGFPLDMNGQLQNSFGLPMGRQGPTKDVKSIIADYRQRNPDITPRRGRRMKSILNPNMMNMPRPIAPKMDGLNNLNNLNMLFNNLDMAGEAAEAAFPQEIIIPSQKSVIERLQQLQGGGLPNGLSFKDILVQFANMQQGAAAGLVPNRPVETVTNRAEQLARPDRRRPERSQHEESHVTPKQAERKASPSPRLPPPPPYPEISLLPVTTSQDTSQTSQQNSLLHGILTKQASPASQSYSPTLAKLLTSPERKQSAPTLPSFGQAKSCGEITITPVQPTPPPAEPQPEKQEEVVQLRQLPAQDDEESAASEGSLAASPPGSGSGRLVIDEGGEGAAAAAGAGAGAGDGAAEGDAPLCQGCRRRDAQFVCAGCANQWYCSRDCQVAAWDEHSETCSG